MLTRQTTLISTNDLGGVDSGGNGQSRSATVSADGRYVVYASSSTNLVSDDTNGVFDVFVYDRAQRANFLISRGPDGAPGNGPSTSPVLAPDGQTIVFNSFASNFLPNDFNNARDVFVLRLGGPDADFDGMEDQWEVTYFGNLDRDGTADGDGDGSRDIDEYRDGTDPTNGQSVFKILPSSHLLGDTRMVVWNSDAGQTYRVEFTSSLDRPAWSDVSGVIAATGSTMTFMHQTSPSEPRGFYRISREPR